MLLTLDGEGALYLRLYRGLRQAILDGRLPARSRLPSSRSIASDLGVSRNVVLLAFDQLADERYIEARPGSGTYVTDKLPDEAITPLRPVGEAPGGPAEPTRLSALARRILALHPLPAPGSHRAGMGLPYDFRYALPAAEDFPHDTWARLVTRRARAMSLRTLWYGRAAGYAPLREAIARYLLSARGVVGGADRLVVVNGTQQGIDLTTRLLVDPGDVVVVEEPSYQAARQVFEAAGAKLHPIPVGPDGIDVTRLPKAARLAFVTPSHQFPLGGVLPLAGRQELLRWAERTGAYILEDDYDGEFRYDRRPMPSLQGLDRAGRVLYLGTFSKVLFPSMRIAYLVMPPPLVAPLIAMKFLTDVHSPTFEQEVLTDFIGEGHLDRHVRRMLARNATRRAVLLEAIARHLGDRAEVVGAEAGVHVVLWLRGIPAAAGPHIRELAAERGVGVYPMTPYYLHEPEELSLLLGYTCLSEAEIRAGIAGLAAALRGFHAEGAIRELMGS